MKEKRSSKNAQPIRVTLARPNGKEDSYVVCGACAELGQGSTITTADGVFGGASTDRSPSRWRTRLITEHRVGSDKYRASKQPTRVSRRPEDAPRQVPGTEAR